MNIIFLDTETTGLENGRIIQLAYKHRDEKDIFVEYYKPPVPIEFEAMGTHHITEKIVADKLPFSEAEISKKLPNILKDAILVAHNAKFDIGILKTEGVETNKYICTYKVAYSLYDYPTHKLQTLRYRWGIDIAAAMAHDAAGDVEILGHVFERMLKDYMEKHGVTAEQAVEAFMKITTEPALLKRLTFGKLRGMSFDEIRKTDFNYLQWLGTLKDKEEDFIYTVNHYLKLGPAVETEAETVPF